MGQKSCGFFFSNILSMKSTRKVGQKSCGFFFKYLENEIHEKSCGFFPNILWIKSTRKVGQKSCGFFSNILWIKSPRKVGQKSCGFFSNILWIFPFSARKLKKKNLALLFSTIFVGFLDKNCRFIAYKSTILVQEFEKSR